MLIGGDSYIWNEENVNKEKPEGATYAFFDLSGKCIYIGSTSNLSERFKHYRSTTFSEDHCKRDTADYQREYRTDYERRERELLEEYKRTYGKLPRCNERNPYVHF